MIVGSHWGKREWWRWSVHSPCFGIRSHDKIRSLEGDHSIARQEAIWWRAFAHLRLSGFLLSLWMAIYNKRVGNLYDRRSISWHLFLFYYHDRFHSLACHCTKHSVHARHPLAVNCLSSFCSFILARFDTLMGMNWGEWRKQYRNGKKRETWEEWGMFPVVRVHTRVLAHNKQCSFTHTLIRVRSVLYKVSQSNDVYANFGPLHTPVKLPRQEKGHHDKGRATATVCSAQFSE